MKKVLFILCLGITTVCFAQYKLPEKEYAEKVLQSKLVILLLDEKRESDKIINSSMKSIFEKNWKLTEVVFMNQAEVEDIIKAKKDGYAILSPANALSVDVTKEYTKTNSGTRQQSGAHVSFIFSYYNVNLSVMFKNKLVEVTNIGFANGELTSIDILFLYQQLSRLIDYASKYEDTKNYYNVKSNVEKCKKSTLILLKDYFRDEDQKNMKTFYEYDYKLVDRAEFEDIILNQKPNNVYAKIIWSNQHKMYIWIVVDAENGATLSQIGFGGIKFGSYHDANDIIKAKHLKYIYSEGGQSFNNKYK
jgi:hypothetical protein